MTRPPRRLSRRTAIGALSVPVLSASAGCLEALDPRSSCRDDTVLSLDPVKHPAHISNGFSTPVRSLPYGTRDVVARAVAAGEATVRDYYAPAVRTRYVVSGSDERYYRLTTADSDAANVTGYEYGVSIEDDPSVADEESVHSFEALPRPDRDSIHSALGSDTLLDAPHYTDFSTVFADDDPANRNASPFIPGTDDVRVKWDEYLLRFSFEGSRPVTLTTTTVTAERVADSLEAFYEFVFEEHGLVLADLPSDRQSIVAEAIDDGYGECPPLSSSFAAVLDGLVADDGDFVPLVAFDGTRYYTHVTASPDELR